MADRESGSRKGVFAFFRGVLFTGLTGAVVILLIGYWVFGHVVPPGYMGVRQSTVGPWQGFSKFAKPAGLYIRVPYTYLIHNIPSTVQVLHLHADRVQYPDTPGPLLIQTTDGQAVEADVSIFSRFFAVPGEGHGGPADLVTKVGLGAEQWRSRLGIIAEDQLKRALGALSTSEFYNPYKREAQVLKAQEGMNNELSVLGMRVEAVLLRRYRYVAERIDEAIFKKNLQDQEVRLRVAAGLLAEAEARIAQVTAEWDAKIKTLLVDGRSEAEVINSQGDLYETRKIAEGDLLVAQAEAEVDRLRAGALAKSQGARLYVARQLTPIIGSLKGGVITDLDPYDIEAWLERLGVIDEERQ